MKRIQYLTLWTTFASSFFILYTLSYAQVETLSEEEYRQEVQTYMTTPCFEEVGDILKKAMDLEEESYTGIELLRIMNAEGLEEIENEMTDFVLKNVKGESNKNKRILYYKMGKSQCIKGMKKNIHNDESSVTQSTEPEDEQDYSIKEKPSGSSENISAQAKQQALKTCKESMQMLGGEMSYRMLNVCIEQELQAYQEFQRNYGD